MANVVQSRVAEMEDVLPEILMENERLVGMTHAIRDKCQSPNENTNEPADGTTSYASVTAVARVKKYENVRKRHDIVVGPKEGEMTSEKLKQIVLQQIQPKMKENAQVSAVRMIRSGGIAI